MESRLKIKISRIFESCRNRNVSSDVIENPIFITENHREFQKIQPFSPKIQPFSPKVRPFGSICKPKLPELMVVKEKEKEKEFFSDDVSVRRRKVTDRGVCFVTAETEGSSCPPASPCSPSNLINQFQKLEIKGKKKKPMKKIKRRDCIRLSSSSSNDGWFSSEKEEETEDETEMFFSSKSFSSDSSESHRRYKKNSRRKLVEARRKKALNKQKTTSTNMGSGSSGLCCSCMKKGKVEDSFAIVKRSSDPRSDFRTSMVEMIIEKQIFQAKDLEKLLQCFLSLNSSHHHRVIVEVFTEIWDALFSNRS